MWTPLEARLLVENGAALVLTAYLVWDLLVSKPPVDPGAAPMADTADIRQEMATMKQQWGAFLEEQEQINAGLHRHLEAVGTDNVIDLRDRVANLQAKISHIRSDNGDS